ncbi:MAG: hypothetical protein ABIS26_00100 [Candidatus Paceibacterota bacterium]
MEGLIIQVPRSMKPHYPTYARVLHPELEQVGRETYDVRKHVRQWLHPCLQTDLSVTGHEIHLELKEKQLLSRCLNLQDAKAIKELGLDTFRQLFGGKAVFFWGSIIIGHNNHLQVPFLFDKRGEFVFEWFRVGYPFDANHPALLFS